MKKSNLLIVGMFAALSVLAAALIVNPSMWFIVAVNAVIGYSIVVKNSKRVQLQRA